MIEASTAWKDVQQRFLLPETFVEIDCDITEVGLQEDTTASGLDEEIFSVVENIRGLAETTPQPKYATLEHNLWALDGTRTILPDSSPYVNAGYVSDIPGTGTVTLSLSAVHTALIPGITITWSSEYGEYPVVFTVTAYNGTTVVAETTITDNASAKSVVDLSLSNYDSVQVIVHNWCLPGHRARIDEVFLGHRLTFTKNEIISYTHEQYGDLLSGELPKYSIEFSIDNTDNRWNPNNPSGMEQFLSTRQKLNVKYGMDVNGTTEWIKAGTFYLSEWSAPSNGLEATFVARDLLEFLISYENPAAYYNSLYGLVESAIYGLLPDDAVVEIDPGLDEYSASYVGDGTAAEMIQKCANAGRCIIRYDRDGALHIEPLSTALSGFQIPLELSFSHPEVTLAKPLKNVSVDYGGEQPYVLSVSDTGEKQTVDNSFIRSQALAELVADWVADILKYRKTISGEFRADPRLDLYDVVEVDSKFGLFSPVVITDIKYTYSGSFRATYTGRVIS